MIKLLILPETVYDQYKSDGVQFTKLLCPNYIASVSSVNDLAEIDAAVNEFPFQFCSNTNVERADSPLVGIALKATSDDVDQFKMKELHNRLGERIANMAIRKAMDDDYTSIYSLYPVDEYLWVAVQKSLHTGSSDPVRLTIKVNHSFFDNMINELTRSCSFEQVMNTNLFNYYLESRS